MLDKQFSLLLNMPSPEHIANVFNFPLHTLTADYFSTEH